MVALTRQFVWTVIPAGRVTSIDGAQMALCSLLLTPRLLGPAGHRQQLKDFGLQTWPQRLAAVRFSALRGGTGVPIQRVRHLALDGSQIEFSVAEQQSAWSTLFPSDMIVQPYQPTSYGGRPIVEFPASQAGQQVSTAYGESSHALATVHHADQPALRASLRAVNDAWRVGLWAQDPSGTAVSPLRRAYDFYRRPAGDFDVSARDVHSADVHDFHYVVARLADHPLLLRALGLLIDLAVPASALAPSGLPATLQVVPAWPSPDPNAPPGWGDAAQQDLSPTTAYALTGERLVPAAATGPLAAPFTLGMLAVAGAGPVGAGSNGRFEIMSFDIDGAALRMVSVAASDGGQPASGHADDPGLPALRSAGFALIDTDRAAEHNNRIQRAQDRATSAGLLGSPLTAENLISGYRVDIFDEVTQQWRSLCQRRAQYSVGDIQIGADNTGLLEEGCLRVDSVTTGAGGDDSMYVHQAIARWDGWSLVASRPERIADPIDIPAQPFTVNLTHDPGSLPRLRFGRRYRLRVRLADLAGGGLQLSEPGTDEQQSQEFTHHRFDPVPAPELLPTRAYTDGEGQGQLVIRSDGDTSADAYAAAHGYRPFDLRYLFPPKAALELALQHGVFDSALGPAGAANVDAFFATATRADHDLADINGAQPHDPGDGSGAYYIVPETGPQLPWLPDPEAPTIALNLRTRPIDPNTGAPGASTGFDDDHHQLTWIGDWPNYVPMALKLVAAEAGCAASTETTDDAATLTIALGRAEQATIDIVSCPNLDDVAALGVAVWAGAKTTTTDDPVTQLIYHGHIRTITPPHTITVVHAVQRPLVDPSGAFVASRQKGDTDAVLRTTELKLDIASTGRIDVHAEWSDFDDIVTEPPSPPTTQSFTTNVGSYDIAHLQPDKAIPTITHTFGDTRRRRVTYSVTAISRFRDYFGAITATDPEACTVRAALENKTDVPSSARPPAPQLRYAMPAFGWSRGITGAGAVHQSTRRGGVRVFLERPWFASGFDESLAVIVSSSFSAPHVSVAGQDPVWTTSSPQSPLNENHLHAPGTARGESLPEAGIPVTAMFYPVTFDEHSNCWLADIDLSPLADTSYFPFVRLSLCRYQANHIQDVPGLSPPVETEPLQLFPSRDLTVTSAAGHVQAVLTGIGPVGSTPNTVHAEVQVADTAAVTDDAVIGSRGWTTIAATAGALGGQLQLNVPDTGAQPLRILVTETESYPSQNPAAGTLSGRLVYAETVRLK